jgi:hypothetical protein
MKIKSLHHPTCPELNGTEEHVSRSVADIAIGFRQAEFVPFKNYVERLSETAREGSDPHNVSAPFVVGVQWEVTALPRSGKIVLLRKQGSETARIEDGGSLRRARRCGQAI